MENEVQKKDKKVIIIAVIAGIALFFAGGLVFTLVYRSINDKNKKDGTTTTTTAETTTVSTTTTTTTVAPSNGGDNNTPTTTQEFKKLSLSNAEGDAYATAFYLSNKTLYAVPTDKSKVKLKNDAKTIDGNKVYKVADNVEKAYSINVGQGDYYQVLYISNSKLYRVAIYADEKKSALSTYQLDYKNVKEVVACSFLGSHGFIVLNKDNQILADTIKNDDGTEDTFIYYDEIHGYYTNNVNGDILTVKKISSESKEDYDLMTFEVTYKGMKDQVVIKSPFGNEKDGVISIKVEKQGDAYGVYDSTW